MERFGFKVLSFADQTKYGSISIIGLGSVASYQLDKISFLESNKILIYNSYSNIDKKSIKQLCDTSDVIFVVINLNDISVGKSIWGLISYLKSLDVNIMIIANTSQISMNLAATLKKQVPFLDLSNQENNDLKWTLKSLHEILYYYNDEYNWRDANYPPSMFWESFFNINSEIFIFQGENAINLLEKIDNNKYLNKQLDFAQHCILRVPNMIDYKVIDALDCKLGEDTEFCCKETNTNDFLLLISI